MCDGISRDVEKSPRSYCEDRAKSGTTREIRDYEDLAKNWPPRLSAPCPRASLYYAYTEDANPYDRIEEFIEKERNSAGGASSIEQIHFDPPLDAFLSRDPYEENAARSKYLHTPPVSFAIFGKPGLETRPLARLIAEWWNCVLISPASLVSEEIDKDTDKGKWIVGSGETGASSSRAIIMNLINCRINRRDVSHRGYVVEGLPLIPSTLESRDSTCPKVVSSRTEECCQPAPPCASGSNEASDDSTSTRSNSVGAVSPSTTLTRRENLAISTGFDFLHRSTIQDTLRRVEDTALLESRINPFEDDPSDGNTLQESYRDYIPEQVNMIFQSWPIKPTIVIYVTCPDEDCGLVRESNRRDRSGKSRKSGETGEGLFGLDEPAEKISMDHETEGVSKLRCEIYKRYALPTIERHVLRHNPQNFIRIEGRMTVSQMFEVVSAKLRCLPLSRAIIPKRIWEHDDDDDDDEPEDVESRVSEAENAKDADDESITREIFDELARKSTVSPKYRWTMSNWKFVCPVESSRGRKVEGKVEFAVRFMNKLFFLSSMKSMEEFLDNPRPFILSMKPRTIVKMAIYGPRFSGKSELGESLGRSFGASVIDVRELMKKTIEERIDARVAEDRREIRRRVVRDLTRKLENERETRETTRRAALNSWFDEAREIVRQLGPFEKFPSVSDDEEESSASSSSSVGEELAEKIRAHGLEVFRANDDLLEMVKNDETMIYNYAPDHLRNEEEAIRELSEHDPEVAAILAKQVERPRDDSVALTNSEIARLIVSRIEMIRDEDDDETSRNAAGFVVDDAPPDPEIWRILRDADVTFDHVILVTEESPYENLLQSRKRYYEAMRQSTENPDDEETSKIEEARAMEDYAREIRDFEEKWSEFRRVILDEAKITPIVWKFDEASDPREFVTKLVAGPYRPEARIMTENEREREFESNTVETVSDDVDEENDDFDGSKIASRIDNDDRPLGDTGIYCPVALARNKILRRGRREYSALYLDKIYLCSSAEALDDFVKDPGAFELPWEEPPREIPRARICIVGSAGSGKSTVSEALSVEYDATHVNFSKLLDGYMRDRGITPLDQSEQDRWEHADLPSDPTDDDDETILAFAQKYVREGAALPKPILDECFLNFFRNTRDTRAVIFDSFPNCPQDVDVMLSNSAMPELVVELECSLEKARRRLLPELVDFFMKKQKSHDDDDDDDAATEGKQRDAISEEEAIERISNEIEEIWRRKNEMLDKARWRMTEESIPWIIVNADSGIDFLTAKLRKIVGPLALRESSPFETTRDLDPYRADDLLECGYYLLSSFGRSCPVQMYRGCNPFQMYLPMDERDEIYPVAHRHYIYFLAGEEARESFRSNPLRYILRDSCDPVVAARISVIGPPGSGKSTLAARLAREYGMRVIDRRDALDWTLNNHPWTKTAVEMERASRTGAEIPARLLARCVDFYCTDYRSATLGYVFDGFPEDRREAEELALLNVRPMIVVNLRVEDRDDRHDGEGSASFHEWLNKFTQNIAEVDGTRSKWAVWRQADFEIRSRFAEIKRYYRESGYERVHRLTSLAVTPYEFKNRQSPRHRSYCPVCLHREDAMTFSGSPPDRRGVVQFRRHFYWICREHLEEFARTPLDFLPPRSAAGLPEIRPRIINDEIDVEHACWARRLVADGNCVVTFADDPPGVAIVPGRPNIAVLHDDRLYLFCSVECREKFLSRPAKYARLAPRLSEATTAAMATEKLTNCRYLEKTMMNVVVDSIVQVAGERPKYPGMSAVVSAAICVGVFLKIRNVACALDEREIYQEARRRLTARSRITRVAVKNMKSRMN